MSRFAGVVINCPAVSVRLLAVVAWLRVTCGLVANVLLSVRLLTAERKAQWWSAPPCR